MRSNRINKFKNYRNAVKSQSINTFYFPLTNFEEISLIEVDRYESEITDVLKIKNTNTCLYEKMKFKKSIVENKFKEPYNILDFIDNFGDFKIYLKQIRVKRFEIQNKNFERFSLINKEQ